MRTLFSCLPGYGHFNPLVPLARALERAGHEVAFATAGRFCRGVVEPAGFLAFPAGLSPLEVLERLERAGAAPAWRRRAGSGAGVGETAMEEQWRLGASMFAGVAAPPKARDLAAAIGSFGPDLVVHDLLDFGAPVASAAASLPSASHGSGPLPPDELFELAAELVAPLWEEVGSEPGRWAGSMRSAYLDTCPPSLQRPQQAALPPAKPLRPVPFDDLAGTGLPAWAGELGRGPVVYATLGTVFNRTPRLLEVLLEGLAETGAEVVATAGPDRDPEELGRQPKGVRVERYVPQSLILPLCDAVVCHGGSGTVLAALALGLPLVLLPRGANQRWNAYRCAELGAGVVLRPEEVCAGAVAAATRAVLGDPAYGRAARRIAEEVAAMPPPEALVDELEELLLI